MNIDGIIAISAFSIMAILFFISRSSAGRSMIFGGKIESTVSSVSPSYSIIECSTVKNGSESFYGLYVSMGGGSKIAIACPLSADQKTYLVLSLDKAINNEFDKDVYVKAPWSRLMMGSTVFGDPHKTIKVAEVVGRGRHKLHLYASEIAGNSSYHYTLGWERVTPVNVRLSPCTRSDLVSIRNLAKGC